jgi:hypothetical protein
MATMERLVAGFYEQAARLSAAGSDGDAALSHYLATAEPLLVLRDLLGHSSVLTTETEQPLGLDCVFLDGSRAQCLLREDVLPVLARQLAREAQEKAGEAEDRLRRLGEAWEVFQSLPPDDEADYGPAADTADASGGSAVRLRGRHFDATATAYEVGAVLAGARSNRQDAVNPGAVRPREGHPDARSTDSRQN